MDNVKPIRAGVEPQFVKNPWTQEGLIIRALMERNGQRYVKLAPNEVEQPPDNEALFFTFDSGKLIVVRSGIEKPAVQKLRQLLKLVRALTWLFILLFTLSAFGILLFEAVNKFWSIAHV